MMFVDYFRFSVGFLEKWTKSSKFGQFRGPTPRHRDPMQQLRSMLRRGMSMLRHGREEAWTSLGNAEA